MPKGPKGERRDADVIKNAVRIMRIATGEIAETVPLTMRAVGGKAGGAARAKALTPKKRQEIAAKAAAARWGRRP